jgi:NAD(P)-dependent dehydrogenase (short-subunit alcohol dehydrogenase family)
MGNMLAGRVAVITGAGRGIGREHALLIAAEGAKVVVNDLGATFDGKGADSTAAEEVVAEITDAGGEAIVNLDSVESGEGAARIISSAIEAFGDLHIVVNNAGILRDRMLVSMSDDDFDAVIAVHLRGTFNVTKHAAIWWRSEAKVAPNVDRAIVNTTSGAGLHGNLGQTNYSAAKAGVAAMTLVNAMELKRYGVRANCIAPFARTRLVEATPGLGELVRDHPAAMQDKVSPLVVCLAAPDCPFSGQVFCVFGGMVGMYQGWSVFDELEIDGRWDPAELAIAMRKFPRKVQTNNPLKRLWAQFRDQPEVP